MFCLLHVIVFAIAFAAPLCFSKLRCLKQPAHASSCLCLVMEAALFKTSLICPCLLSPPKAHYLDKVVKGMALLLSYLFSHFSTNPSFKKLIFRVALVFSISPCFMPHQHSPCRIMLLLYLHIQYAALPPRHLAPSRPLSGWHESRSVSLAALSLLWNSGGWMAHGIQGGRAGGGSRTLPTGAMHNGCSVQLCSTAEGVREEGCGGSEGC